jgi:uncharacterized repeat protein (TIGR01451 family)
VDFGKDIAVASGGNVYVVGEVQSFDFLTATFPTRNALQPNFGGGFDDAWVVKIDSSPAVVWATYLGGDGFDDGMAIAVDAAGNVCVTGLTSSDNFPLANAAQPVRGAGFKADAFVTKIASSGASLLYSTYLGGPGSGALGEDVGQGIAVDGFGNIYVSGRTSSTNFPVTPGADQTNFNASLRTEAFVAKLNPDVVGPPSLIYASYLGGSGNDADPANANFCRVAVDGLQNFYVAGLTTSTNFPVTAGAYRTNFSGGSIFGDAFIAKFASPADLAVTLSSAPQSVSQGSNVTCTIKAFNSGRSSFTNVMLTDTLPPGMQFVSANPAGNCSHSAGTVTCSLGTLTNDATATVSIIVTATTGGAKTNTALLTASQPELNAANNTANNVTLVRGVADVALSKIDQPDPVYLMSNLVYILTVTNRGPTDATSLMVTDTLPASITFVSAFPSRPGQDFCALSGNILVCTLGTLSTGATATITVTVRPTATGSLTNRATVSLFESDPVTADNSVSTVTTVLPVAELVLTKTGIPATAFVSSNLTYSLAVTNRGPSSATSVTLTDALPATVMFVSANASQGSGCSLAGSVVTCNLGSLASNAVATATIIVKPTAAGSLTNSAGVSSSVFDPASANNIATAVNIAAPLANLGLTVTESRDPVVVSNQLVYTITVTNRGPSPATQVVLSNALTAGVEVVSAGPSQGTCSTGAGVVTCALGTISANASALLTLTVRPTAAGSITNTSTVTSEVADAATADNTVKTTTTVIARPQLAIALAGTNVVLSWTNSATGFSLEATGQLATPGDWMAVTNMPVVTNAQKVVTLGLRATNQFFRLKQP